jgi:hypothetical protein
LKKIGNQRHGNQSTRAVKAFGAGVNFVATIIAIKTVSCSTRGDNITTTTRMHFPLCAKNQDRVVLIISCDIPDRWARKTVQEWVGRGGFHIFGNGVIRVGEKHNVVTFVRRLINEAIRNKIGVVPVSTRCHLVSDQEHHIVT